MQALFYVTCISIIIAASFLSYLLCFEPNYKNKTKNILYNHIFKYISIIFLCIIGVYITITFGPFNLVFYLLVCIGIFLILAGIYQQENFTLFISVIIILIFGSSLLNFNFDTLNNKLEEYEVILTDYSGEKLNQNEKVIVIEIDTNEFVIKKYTVKEDFEISFPLYFKNYTSCKKIRSGTNKIVISTNEKIGTDILAYFNLKEPDITIRSSKIVYINTYDIIYNN